MVLLTAVISDLSSSQSPLSSLTTMTPDITNNHSLLLTLTTMADDGTSNQSVISGKGWSDLLDSLLLEVDSGWERQDFEVNVLQLPCVQPALVYAGVALLLIPGIFGNVLLFFLSFHCDVRSHSYSVYLAIVSVSDTLSLASFYTEMLTQTTGSLPFFSYSDVHLCRLKSLVVMLATSLSPWVLVAFSFDRYIAMVFPLKRKVFCTVRNARITGGCVVVLSVAVLMPIITSLNLVRFRNGVTCAVTSNVIFYYICMETGMNAVVPCILLASLNIHSLIAIKRGILERMTMAMAGAAHRSSGATSAGWTGRQTHAQTGRPGERGSGERIGTEMLAEGRKLTRSLLTIPLFAFITLMPHALLTNYISLALTDVSQPHRTAFEDTVLNAEPYTRVIMSMGFAGNFYLLMLTSRAFRKIAEKVLRLSQ